MKTSLIFRQQRGSALAFVMILVIALSLAVVAVTGYVNTSAKIAAQAEDEIKASRAAEAALELNMARLNQLAASLRPAVPTLPDVTAACNLSTAPTGLFPEEAGYTFNTNIAIPIESGVPVASFSALSDATKTYRYLSATKVTYARPQVPAVTVSMQREFIHRVIPLFQYAIFYDDVLELNPGANFTVGGRVHSNKAFYYGSSSTLTFNGIVTSASPLGSKNSRNPSDPRTGSYGGAAVFANGTPPTAPYIVSTIPFPCSTTDATNVNQSGPLEFIEMPVSTVADPNAADREYTLAGLKILMNTSATDSSAGSSKTVNGYTVPPRTRISGSPYTPPLAAMYQPLAVTTNQTISGGYNPGFILLTESGKQIPLRNAAETLFNPLYTTMDTILNGRNQTITDYRQGSTVTNITTIDVSKLAAVVDNVPAFPLVRVDTKVPNTTDYGVAAGKSLWNGIVYIHDVTFNGGANPVGIALVNGKVLPSRIVSPRALGGGLTVVTDHPAYIVGDYNTGGTPPVNSGAITDSPTIAGYTVRPASLMADAVTILSEKWFMNGYNTKSSSSSRVPVPTTVNAALLTGNVPSTKPGSYSGGAENFPRLLEVWAGVRLTFYGSMICLFPSRYANQVWGGNYYSAATRNWYFEPTFANPNKLPPGTPNAIVFSNGEWVRF